VIDLGTIPTPTFYRARHLLRTDAGVMVTASHNPPEYNGFKITLGFLPITEEELADVRSLAEDEAFSSGSGQSRRFDVLPEYETFIVAEGRRLMEGVASLPPVVVDCGNGSYSEIAPRAFQALGIPICPLYCTPDGSFPNRSPNSAIASNLTMLSRTVRKEHAHLGVAFDGDGDRVSFADETGAILGADTAIAIFARYLPGGIRQNDAVVLDIKCGMAASEVVRGLGARPLIEKSGHTFIKTRMILESAPFGGEVSGHFFFGHLQGGDDGLYAALLMTSIIARHGPLSYLAKQVPQYVSTPDIRVPCYPDLALFDSIAAAFPVEQVSRLDGVRVIFSDGWALARPSVTEPAVTLRFEGRNREALRNIIRQFLAPSPWLEEVAKKSGLSLD
jgi:phosphomannomutase/phosphoglucomutase